MNRKKRRIINNQGCVPCEVCSEPNYLVQHHISGRNIERPNEHNNLANVCSNCHLKIHKGEIIIEKRVMTTNGYTLMWHKSKEKSITGDDSSPYTY